MKKEDIQFTAEEKAIIKLNREQAEKTKRVSEKVNALLIEEGMTLQITGINNLQIAVVPVRPNA